FRLRVTHQRADLDVGVFQGGGGEPADAVDVDQQRGLAQPHVERGNQALSAGKQPRVVVRQQLDRVRDRAGLGIGKRCRLQPVLPAASRLSLLSPLRASRQSLPGADREYPNLPRRPWKAPRSAAEKLSTPWWGGRG